MLYLFKLSTDGSRDLALSGEKRSKVKKPKMDFPIYQPSADETNFQSYPQSGSIQEVEEQLDQWLQDQRPARKQVPSCSS